MRKQWLSWRAEVLTADRQKAEREEKVFPILSMEKLGYGVLLIPDCWGFVWVFFICLLGFFLRQPCFGIAQKNYLIHSATSKVNSCLDNFPSKHVQLPKPLAFVAFGMNLTFIAESLLLCFQRIFLPSKVTVFLKHSPLKALKHVEYRRVICSLRLYMSCIKNYKMRIYGCAESTHRISCMVRRKQVMANLVHSLQIREAPPFVLFCFLGLGSNPHLSINVNNCVWVKSAFI